MYTNANNCCNQIRASHYTTVHSIFNQSYDHFSQLHDKIERLKMHIIFHGYFNFVYTLFKRFNMPFHERTVKTWCHVNGPLVKALLVLNAEIQMFTKLMSQLLCPFTPLILTINYQPSFPDHILLHQIHLHAVFYRITTSLHTLSYYTTKPKKHYVTLFVSTVMHAFKQPSDQMDMKIARF